MDESSMQQQQGVGPYIKVLRALWFVRLLDFLAMGMVIPTLHQYFLHAGGGLSDYYLALNLTTIAMMLCSMLLGVLLDHCHCMRMVFAATVAFSIFGNLLYYAADAFPEARHPATILVARVIVGCGSSNFALGFAFLGKVAMDQERQTWVVGFSMTRSLGLLAGPGITSFLTWTKHSIALPGLLLGVANVVALLWLLVVWKEPPALPRLREPPAARGSQLRRFIRQPHVWALYLSNLVAPFITNATQYMIPVIGSRMARRAAGSLDHLVGVVFVAIALGVLLSQTAILRFKRRVQDWQLLLFGVCVMPFMLMMSVVMWLCMFGTDFPIEPAPDLAGALLVMCPFVLVESVLPYVSTSAVAVYTRLVCKESPHQMGVLQVLMSNAPVLGVSLSPIWDAWTYSESHMEVQGLPIINMLGLSTLSMLSMWFVIMHYRALRPLELHESFFNSGTELGSSHIY